MMPRHDARDLSSASSWYRQPVLWLGVVVFAASMAGCVWLIVVSSRHADIPVDTSHTVFGVPSSSHSSNGPPP
ncbi:MULTISPECIES: hypothetical protein [unclassified Rhodanobacter]|nr:MULTISPECIES: hypothetical protein [unclassified Rhodanobacter]OOG38532.1 hypothetical protein B0E51_13310 [Rhodanobacter sp. C05]OOG50130.1 hypothetical protein B0E50_03070 [Rhodanobacter sp. C01]OOG52316.1 hypothetical protein B0E48_17260 [Rhodanobacter sp. C03]OOG65951.1 hypothetical protein B0E46_00070 [Rhodanobacter sp. B04]